MIQYTCGHKGEELRNPVILPGYSDSGEKALVTLVLCEECEKDYAENILTDEQCELWLAGKLNVKWAW